MTNRSLPFRASLLGIFSCGWRIYVSLYSPIFWESFSKSGREKYHENLRINVKIMLLLMRQPSYGRNIEFTDNRISLFSAQWGKCAVTGRAFQCLEEIHCHHKTPQCQGGGDEYANLILVWEPVHKLIHASNSEAIQKYLSILNLDRKQMATLNVLRKLASMPEIV